MNLSGFTEQDLCVGDVLPGDQPHLKVTLKSLKHNRKLPFHVKVPELIV